MIGLGCYCLLSYRLPSVMTKRLIVALNESIHDAEIQKIRRLNVTFSLLYTPLFHFTKDMSKDKIFRQKWIAWLVQIGDSNYQPSK